MSSRNSYDGDHDDNHYLVMNIEYVKNKKIVFHFDEKMLTTVWGKKEETIHALDQKQKNK